ncbi:MAG TPA: ribosome biogenesis GTPase Der [Rhizomicrobium sp.]|jgi:GTP-binding protein|nr:ribosome biogenesis GTPase Der [Rhizomicrobium sp.]
MMPPAVVILGRPNVGKSTLFNRLAGRRAAIVHDTPGVTRDCQEEDVRRGDLAFRLIDTAGFDEADPGSLAQRMTEQTLAALGSADVCLFLIDARSGVTTGDDILARAIRRAGKPVILLANKSEGRTADLGDALRWGFGEPIAVSAEHGTGMEELFDALAPFATDADADEENAEDASQPLRLAIVGRPNVGKSTLFNALLGEERVLTGPEAGITRDSIAARFEAEGRAILLHDTAGLRRRARAAGQPLEQLAVASALTAIRFAECVIVVIDATQPFEKQELAIADLIVREGRAVIFAVNKWDRIESRPGAIKVLRQELDRLLPQIAGAPLVAISALTGEGLSRLLPAVIAADRAWNRRVPTAELNRFLARALERHPPPAVHGRRIRVRYMTEPKARPPTFALFGTQLDALPESWLRYLQNELRASFDLAGAPIRISLHTSKNPYAKT